jgi:hypothetical protein
VWQRHAYPAARVLDPPPTNVGVPRYERAQSLTAQSTLADTIATLITFSGTPDAIVLAAENKDALFTLTDRLDRDPVIIAVPTGSVITVQLARERVKAQNAAAGQTSTATVTGLWAARNEQGSDPRRGKD